MQLKVTEEQQQNFLQREWLDANGRGSYASSTLLDCPTRRYHGLLVSDAGYLDEKWVLLAKLEASLQINDHTIDLFTNKHPDGNYYPEGAAHIETVRYELGIHTRYRLGEQLLERSIQLLHDEDTVLIRYQLLAGEPCRLLMRPLLAYRSQHHLRSESREFQVKTFPTEDGWKIEPLPQRPALHMNADRSISFFPGPFWVKQVEYAVEQERGFDYQEDLFCPGLFEAHMSAEQVLLLSFSLNPCKAAQLPELWSRESSRRKQLFARFADQPSPLPELKFEAEKFLIQRRDTSPSVVAGYPWFGEWGRDAMIALPGLTLSRGQPERLIEIVKTFLSQARDGMIPNFLGQGHAPANYSSIDAALWLFLALDRYRAAGHSLTPLAPLRQALTQILVDLHEGRCPQALCSRDGLLRSGTPETQLTWMDAKVHGHAVTPRQGWAVEINALWYNALGFMVDWAQASGEAPPRVFLQVLELMPRAFRQAFWIEDGQYLADTVQPETGLQDRSVRPNQIFAISLARPLLLPEQEQAVLRKVTAELLTPYGLRTLSPFDDAFVPFYQGNPAQRDGAYHQGTVWPWLLGAYVDAFLRLRGKSEATKAFLRKNLEPLWTDHLTDAGLRGISEIFDAQYPYRANGCIFQAWSTAEIIRVLELLLLE